MNQLCILPLLLIVIGATAEGVDLSGRWTFSLKPATTGVPEEVVDCTLTENHQRLTLKCGNGTGATTGEVQGRKVTLRAPPIKTNGKTSVLTFSGEVDISGTILIGTWRFVLLSGAEIREGNFTATRVSRQASPKSN